MAKQSKIDGDTPVPEPRNKVRRTPLRLVQLTKTITAYTLYISKHDTLNHNEPGGLRLTLINDSFVLVEGPAHPRDERRLEKGVNFRVPREHILYMEDLVPVKHRFDPTEHKALVQFAADRTNYLADVDPDPQPQPKVAASTAATVSPSAPDKDSQAFRIGAHTSNEQELLDDEAADEAAERDEE